MDTEGRLLHNLQTISKWATAAIPLPTLKTNDEYMTMAVELYEQLPLPTSGWRLSLARSGTSRKGISEGSGNHRWPPRLVRVSKLYDALAYHTANGQRDICMILTRPILETLARMEYLIRAEAASFRSFVLTSYRPEKEMLDDLEEKASTRELTPIEQRMLASIRNHMEDDRISADELRKTRKWDLDGKNFRRLLSDVGWEEGYVYMFGNGSHWVHGDWFDIKTHHLSVSGELYEPSLGYEVPDPRGVCPITLLCLSQLASYMKWNESDSAGIVGPIIKAVSTVARALDGAHERSLQD